MDHGQPSLSQGGLVESGSGLVGEAIFQCHGFDPGAPHPRSMMHDAAGSYL